MPKTSVRPLATRNSTSPYCTPLSSCTAKVARSMQAPGEATRSGVLPSPLWRGVWGWGSEYAALSRTHVDSLPNPPPQGRRNERAEPGLRRGPAAQRRVGERLMRDRDVAIEPALRLAQIDVLHHVVRLGEADRPARRIDLGGLHGGEHLVTRRDVALHGGEPDLEQLARVKALHRIDVAILAGLLLEAREKGLVGRIVEVVGVMQRGLDAFGVRPLSRQRAVGEEARPIERDRGL